MSLVRNIAIAGILAALPCASWADSNGNPCIENWKPIALLDIPVANVTTTGGPFQVIPGGETSIRFDYTIVDGERVEREFTLCRGEQLRDAVLEGSFDGSQRVIEANRAVSFAAPAAASASYIVRVPAPGLFIYYQESNGTPHQYWYNPGVSVPVSVVVDGVMPQSDELEYLFSDKTDSDNDGLVDSWEIYYFADLSQGPSGDFDSDGINNLQEANVGFNPNVVNQFAAPIISIASDGSDQLQAMIAPIDANGQIVTKEYEGIQIVRIANPNALGEIRYTIDGSAPSATSLACVSGDGVNLGSLGDVEVKAAIMLNGAVVSSSTKLIKQKFTPQAKIPAPSEVWKADVFADYGFTMNYTVQGVLTYWKGAYTPYLEDIYKSFVPNATIIYPGVNAIQMGDEVPGGDVMLTSRTSLGTGWICIDFSKNNSLVFFTLLSRVTWEDGKLGEPTATALAYLYYSPKRFALLHPHAYACWRPAPYGFASFVAENTDTDGDGLWDAYEYFVYSTKHNSGDSDGDGLGDLFEAQRAYLNPNSNVDASADWDNDGKTFLEEKIAGTNPFHNDLDNDGDGLPDALEISQYGTSPDAADTDNDGIPDAFELSIGSNPLVAKQEVVSAKFQAAIHAGWRDSDSDWMPDAFERQFPSFLNPKYAQDAALDFDQDGLSNLQEYRLGTGLNNIDSDSDGMPDGWEVGYALNPKSEVDSSSDSDGDLLVNLLEYQFNADPTKSDGDIAAHGQMVPHPQTGVINSGDGLTDLDEVLIGLNPLVYDTHNASHARTGLNYWLEHNDAGTDSDGDGLSDYAENLWGTLVTSATVSSADSDGDGMPDGWEVAYRLDPKSAGDATGDPDNDGVTNLEEYQLGLLPNDFDSDDDGLGDGWEIEYNFDPQTLLTDLTAWWRFDGTPGQSIFADSAGHLHDGLMRGQAKIESGGRLSNALKLDGKDAYAVIRDHQNLRLANNAAISFWYRPDTGSLSSESQLFDKRGSYSLTMLSGGRLRFTWYVNGTTGHVDSVASLVHGQWNHIFMSIARNPSRIQFGVSGNLEVAQSVTLPEMFEVSSWPLILGSPRVLPVSLTPKGYLDDFRIYSRVLSADDISKLSNPDNPTLEQNRDDEDGVGDGLTNLEESNAGTRPDAKDTDGDLLDDSAEVKIHHTNPRLVDTDGDGLSDYDEIVTYHTNALNQDADGDNLNDFYEITLYQTSSSTAYTHGYKDREGNNRPDGWDSDGDGMPDGWEVFYKLNPSSAADRTLDLDADGILNHQEYQLSKDPNYPDNISTAIDTDGDGLTDWEELYVHHTNPNTTDSFGDGLGDAYRVANRMLDPNNPDHLASANPDGDSWTNFEESQLGTNPFSFDNRSANLFEAMNIRKKPEKIIIAHNAPEPAPETHRGPVISLSYQPGDSVYIAADDTNERLIAVADDIYIGTEKLSSIAGVKPGKRPDKMLGSPAETAYEFQSEYNITGYVDQLPRDPQTGRVSFSLVVKNSVPFDRLPDPNPPTGGGGGNSGVGTGGSGNAGTGTGSGGTGSSNSSSVITWPELSAIMLANERATTNPNPQSPNRQEQSDPVVPTWGTTRLVAYINNRLDLSVSHACSPDRYLSEKDEDDLGAIASVAYLNETGVETVPQKKSILHVGKGPAVTAKQILTWDDSKLVVLDGGQALSSPHEFVGNEAHELAIYGKLNSSNSAVMVALEGKKADNSSVIIGNPDVLKVNLIRMELAVDANGDGSISLSHESVADVTNVENPYLYWSNDDDDYHPNSAPALSYQPDWQSVGFDGPDDLVDVFPLFLNIKELLGVLLPLETEGYKIEYKLKQSGGALGAAYTRLTRASAFDYRGHGYDSTGYGVGGIGSIFDNPPVEVSSSGLTISKYFLYQIRDEGKGILLIEGRNVNSNPLVLSVELGGVVIAEATLYLRPVGLQLLRGGIGDINGRDAVAPVWRSQAGVVRDVVSIWPTHSSSNNLSELKGDWVQARINLGDFDMSKMPNNYILWSVDGYPNITPNTLTTPRLRWPDGAGTVKTISVTVGGRQFRAHVDIPDVGDDGHLMWLSTRGAGAATIFGRAWAARSDAIAWAGRYPGKSSVRNALQHCAWMAYCSSSMLMTASDALELGVAHEYDNFSSGMNWAYESTMDIHNNIMGTTIIRRTPLLEVDIEAINAEIIQMLLDGDLYIWDSPHDEHTGFRATMRSDGSTIYP